MSMKRVLLWRAADRPHYPQTQWTRKSPRRSGSCTFMAWGPLRRVRMANASQRLKVYLILRRLPAALQSFRPRLVQQQDSHRSLTMIQSICRSCPRDDRLLNLRNHRLLLRRRSEPLPRRIRRGGFVMCVRPPPPVMLVAPPSPSMPRTWRFLWYWRFSRCALLEW